VVEAPVTLLTIVLPMPEIDVADPELPALVLEVDVGVAIASSLLVEQDPAKSAKASDHARVVRAKQEGRFLALIFRKSNSHLFI
jgi:hypothetical protein